MRIYPAYRFIIALLTLSFSVNVTAGGGQAAKVEESTDVLTDILHLPEKSIPPSLLYQAQAIAIIPAVIKVGFVIGGRYGKGLILLRNAKTHSWSSPVFLELKGGSLGIQLGAQSADIILVFKNKRGLDNLINGKFTLGADASVSAGPVGRNAAAATDIQLKSEILSYSRSRGLFAGVSLDGSNLGIDHSANADFYGVPNVTPQQIFQQQIDSPVSVEPLRTLLQKHAKQRL